MKRRLCALTAALMLLLGGCRGPAASWRDIERLRPVQTLGFDREDGLTTVCAAAGTTSSGKTPPVAAQTAGSIETALTALQNAFPEGEPYYAHVQYLILGRRAAEEGAEPWLSWVFTRPEMRLDAAVFVTRDTAAELILGAAGKETGSAEKLKSLETGFRQLGEGYAVSLRELSSSLAERGAGLCGAVRAVSPDEALPYEDADSLRPDGFALFQTGEPVVFLDQEAAFGPLLILGHCEGARIELTDAVASVLTGSAKTKHRGDTVTLEARLTASVAEAAGPTDIEALQAALTDYVMEQLRSTVELEQRHDADYLGLTDGASPADTRFLIRVRARIDRESEGGEA